ncbi:MAG TPA: TSCPD domain-containing protein, partial [Oscillospiraceae bacterium]|nr:TSCPD domain-containing protein [Oscillospiraceae bacterium]
CGEQPLLPYESCNLGSINLSVLTKETEDGVEIDYERLGKIVRDAVHFLDNVIDVNRYPLEQIDKTTKATRKIGLGIMGWADLLLKLGIPYCSDEAVDLAETLMGFITETGRGESEKLAEIRGAFPLFGESIYKDGKPLRNATVTTIAPTGTLSIIAGCSSGVEPVFAYAYIRNIMDNTKMVEVSPVLKALLEERSLASEELMNRIAEHGSLAHIMEIPEDIRRVYITAHDVSPEYHIRMQAAFQRHTDNAVSKTVNFKNEATQDEVRHVFDLAYSLGCKGVTIYRDGSRDSQVLNIGKEEKKDSASVVTVVEHAIVPRPRPDTVFGITERMRIGCGNLYVTVNYDKDGICEIFTNTGKEGGCPSQSEATARLISVALRSGISIDEIIKQIRGIRCPSTIRQPGLKCTSCPDAIARVIKKVYDMQIKGMAVSPESMSADAPQVEIENPNKHTLKYCPECGELLEHEGGCVSCRSCGWSKCN